MSDPAMLALSISALCLLLIVVFSLLEEIITDKSSGGNTY